MAKLLMAKLLMAKLLMANLLMAKLLMAKLLMANRFRNRSATVLLMAAFDAGRHTLFQGMFCPLLTAAFDAVASCCRWLSATASRTK
jgi:hypothetical protein